jgi:hypothetical protein
LSSLGTSAIASFNPVQNTCGISLSHDDGEISKGSGNDDFDSQVDIIMTETLTLMAKLIRILMMIVLAVTWIMIALLIDCRLEHGGGLLYMIFYSLRGGTWWLVTP